MWGVSYACARPTASEGEIKLSAHGLSRMMCSSYIVRSRSLICKPGGGRQERCAFSMAADDA
eukprot:1144234-Pelagomonas_calceolata.AAC.5